MASKKYNVLIVGAGIAGLSAAIALVGKGYSVTILEGAPQVMQRSNNCMVVRLMFLSLLKLELAYKFLPTLSSF
jgi:2-polyprenyl-6-methoxyphenol hydroxylase-like FAD-dependent oxidoreductase